MALFVFSLAEPALYMADALLQATEMKAQQAGAALYESVFRKSRDADCRKQVVENIITHVGSGKVPINKPLNTPL